MKAAKSCVDEQRGNYSIFILYGRELIDTAFPIAYSFRGDENFLISLQHITKGETYGDS